MPRVDGEASGSSAPDRDARSRESANSPWHHSSDNVDPAVGGRPGEHGTVTAEAALVLPMIVLFTVGMAWLVSVGVTHVRAVDAARETARAVARGEAAGDGRSVGMRVAAAGSSIHVDRRSGTVVVTVTSPVRGPGGLFDFVHPFDVHAQAVAVREPES